MPHDKAFVGQPLWPSASPNRTLFHPASSAALPKESLKGSTHSLARFRSYSQLALARVGGWKWRHDCIFHPQLARHEAIPKALWPRSSTPKSKSANHAMGWPVYVCAATSDAPGASVRALATSAQTACGTPMRRC